MNYLLLKTELDKPAYDGLTPAEALDSLNTANIANQSQQAMVPQRLIKNTAFSLLSYASAAKLLVFPNLKMIHESFDLQDHLAATQWVQSLVIPGIITQCEARTVSSYINDQVPDPNYKPLLSWCELNDLQPTEQDVKIARFADQTTAFQELFDATQQKLATIAAMLGDLRTGNAWHDLSEVGG